MSASVPDTLKMFLRDGFLFGTMIINIQYALSKGTLKVEDLEGKGFASFEHFSACGDKGTYTILKIGE